MPDRPDDPDVSSSDDTGPVWRVGERYRVIDRIGSGGMADVFRAHDEMLQRDVALKVFRTGVSDTAAGADRQRAELLALASLNHPHLITLYDGSVAAGDGPTYLVMELIDGPTLGARIGSGPLPEPEVREIGAQVADALAYVHANGMVHRDVKPANILLGADSGSVRARLSDFGIVRLLGTERLTSVESTLGTASYLAPEQARGSGVGPAADIYALGLTLIEALTGTRSFDGATPLEAVVARLDHDPAIPQHLPAPWPALLAAMTARDPARRPDAGQVAQALRGSGSTTQFIAPLPGADAGTAVLSRVGPPPSVRPMPVSGPPRQPAPRPSRGFPAGWIVAAGVAIAIIAAGLIILFATTGGDDPSAPVTSTTAKQSTSTSTSTKPTTRARSTDPTDEQSASKPKPKKTKTKTKASKPTPAPTTTSAPGTRSNPPSVSQSAPSDTTSP